MTHEHPEHKAPVTAQEWDARYDTEHIWSGNPNGALVAEAVMDIFDLAELQICPWALREGVILERLDQLSVLGNSQ